MAQPARRPYPARSPSAIPPNPYRRSRAYLTPRRKQYARIQKRFSATPSSADIKRNRCTSTRERRCGHADTAKVSAFIRHLRADRLTSHAQQAEVASYARPSVATDATDELNASDRPDRPSRFRRHPAHRPLSRDATIGTFSFYWAGRAIGDGAAAQPRRQQPRPQRECRHNAASASRWQPAIC